MLKKTFFILMLFSISQLSFAGNTLIPTNIDAAAIVDAVNKKSENIRVCYGLISDPNDYSEVYLSSIMNDEKDINNILIRKGFISSFKQTTTKEFEGYSYNHEEIKHHFSDKAKNLFYIYANKVGRNYYRNYYLCPKKSTSTLKVELYDIYPASNIGPEKIIVAISITDHIEENDDITYIFNKSKSTDKNIIDIENLEIITRGYPSNNVNSNDYKKYIEDFIINRVHEKDGYFGIGPKNTFDDLCFHRSHLCLKFYNTNQGIIDEVKIEKYFKSNIKLIN